MIMPTEHPASERVGDRVIDAGVFPPKSAAFLARIARETASAAPADIANRVASLVAEHEQWRRACLNLNPAESLLSRSSRRLLDSDLATRLGEGPPGDKLYPHGSQTRFCDEIEAVVIALAQRQFGARHVEWRPVSTTMANAIVFHAFLQPGDVVLSQNEDGGGNYSYHSQGPLALTGARIASMARGGPTFEIDVDAVGAQIATLKPRMIVIGGSNVLFPYPVRELRRLADSVGALLVYDAAHIGLLISSGDFQRPLVEGAHIVTLSTHKIMGGPVGGLILTNEPELARAMVELTFPGFMQTRDQNKYAALAVALAEFAEHGEQLARQMVVNARALAKALDEEGFEIIGRDRGYTRTHQIFVDLGATAREFEERCQAANILASDCALSGDMERRQRSGARLATHELTRLGMSAADMIEVARLIRRAALDSETAESVRSDVQQLLSRFPSIRFSFDSRG